MKCKCDQGACFRKNYLFYGTHRHTERPFIPSSEPASLPELTPNLDGGRTEKAVL